MTKEVKTKKPEKKGELVPIAAEMADQLVPGWKQLREHVLMPVLGKREEGWLRWVYEYLKRLENKSGQFTVEDLFENEAFLTAFVRAGRAAISTHQKETLEALRNAVLNSALPGAPEDNKQAIFLSCVDNFTPLHLKLLSFYREHSFKEGSFEEQIEQAIPDLEPNFYMYHSIVTDLDSRGFIIKGYMGTEINSTHMLRAEITTMAIEFLDFITSPLEDER
jgi:hypothetical protein